MSNIQNTNWSFQDNFTWGNNYPQCLAKNQSPININSEQTQLCKSFCDFNTYYKTSECYINYKNNLITIKYSSGSYLEYQNILYELREITIHTPSLHSIDNSKYDLELCLIHKISNDNKGTKNKDTPDGIILCRLLEEGPHYGKIEQFINQFINEIPKETISYDKLINVSNDWSANNILPENKSFFMYDGSLPFPPCNTNYKIIVYEDIGRIGRTNLEIFKLNIGENIRSIQDMGKRVVMYKPYYGESNQTIIEVNDNKFLKCEKKIESDLLESTTSALAQTEQTIIDEGINPETKNILKQLVLFTILLFILVIAIIFVVYLFRNNFAQKLIIAFGPDFNYFRPYLAQWSMCSR